MFSWIRTTRRRATRSENAGKHGLGAYPHRDPPAALPLALPGASKLSPGGGFLLLDTCPLGRYNQYMVNETQANETGRHGMLVNVENAQGRVNAALRNWNGETQRYDFEPVVGAVLETGEGGYWQIRDTSWWLDGAWTAESDRTDASWDGIKVRVTGRTIQHSSKVGEAVRVEITFVGDGDEADAVTRGWMKV